VSKLVVFERDEWHCQICRSEVDPALAFPHPQSASLDHKVPITKGGSHTYANVQLAHLACNQAKGNRIYDPTIVKTMKVGGAQ
jgi:5-methylcytosine-specific restriction endonuclease McrA